MDCLENCLILILLLLIISNNHQVCNHTSYMWILIHFWIITWLISQILFDPFSNGEKHFDPFRKWLKNHFDPVSFWSGSNLFFWTIGNGSNWFPKICVICFTLIHFKNSRNMILIQLLLKSNQNYFIDRLELDQIDFSAIWKWDHFKLLIPRWTGFFAGYPNLNFSDEEWSSTRNSLNQTPVLPALTPR